MAKTTVGQTVIEGTNLFVGQTPLENRFIGNTKQEFSSLVQIQLVNFPSEDDILLEGEPGATVVGTRARTITYSASSGMAYNGAGSASGHGSSFTLSGNYASTGTSITTHTFTWTAPSTFPEESILLDYDDLTISQGSTATVNSASLTITTSNVSGGGCSTFSSSCNGSMSAASANSNNSGGLGTDCQGGTYRFNSYNIPGVGSSSFSYTSSRTVSNMPAPGSYSGTAGGVTSSTWAAWLPNHGIYGGNLTCPSGRICYTYTPTWTASGGGNLNASYGGGTCSIYLNALISCPSSGTKTLTMNFSTTGNSYGGSCRVNYTI